jgi:hypothetical protein
MDGRDRKNGQLIRFLNPGDLDRTLKDSNTVTYKR